MNKFMKLDPRAQTPRTASTGAAGADLYAIEDYTIRPGQIVTLPLGFATELDHDIHGRIESRSGMAIKGLVVLTGVIDSDYRGEWKVIMQNTTRDSVHQINAGDRVAQVVFRPTIHPVFEAVESLTDTARGAGGFGSTGTK